MELTVNDLRTGKQSVKTYYVINLWQEPHGLARGSSQYN